MDKTARDFIGFIIVILSTSLSHEISIIVPYKIGRVKSDHPDCFDVL